MLELTIFSIGLLISILAYWILVPVKLRAPFLLVLSVIFAALFNAVIMFYFFLNSIIIYWVGVLINRDGLGRKSILKLAIIWLVGNLCFFKYGNSLFFPLTKRYPLYLSNLRIEFPEVLLPLGISYITFKLIHYVVEVYRKNIVNNSFVGVALYVLFFPTFLAGPVERFQSFNQQALGKRDFDITKINYGLYRIICGLLKKVFIADNLSRLIMPLFISPDSYPKWILILSVYCMAIQLYMDFSGYTDIAIGIARLFGYVIMENFNKPYFQKNIALFWRSWHISVYSWIRDYFFFPIFGHRVSRMKIYAGTVITMIVFHLWHAASLSFLILGVYHGTGLVIWQVFQHAKKKSAHLRNMVSYKWLGLFSWFLTFSFVSFGCIFFNSDAQTALHFIKRIF